MTCWRCDGRGWVHNCDIEDGMMTGRDNCSTCKGTGKVSPEQVLSELRRVLAKTQKAASTS